MREENQAYCKNCKALIIFIKTENGKNMPCNVNPVPYREDYCGDARVLTRSGKLIRCTLDCTKEECSGYGYVPHWGSCISHEGRKRLEGYKGHILQKAAPAVMETPKKAELMNGEPQYEQMSLFSGMRVSRHPM